MKNVAPINDTVDIVNKGYVDALTDTFVKTFDDSFTNDDYIASSSNMTRENGYIRANRQYQVNQSVFSDANGTKTGQINYDANRLTLSTTTNSNLEGTYTTNWHTGLTSTNSIYLASNFNHYNADTIQNEVQVTPASGTLQSDVINYKQIVDINNRVWHFYQVRSTGSVWGWVTDISNNSVIAHTLLSTGVAAISSAPAVPAYRTLNTATSDDGNVYVSFWTGGSTSTGRIRTIKMRVNSGLLQFGTTANAWQSGTVAFDDYNPAISGFFCIDSFYDDITDRLHLFYQANNTTQGASHRTIAGTTFQVHGQTVILADSGAKQVVIAYNPTVGGRELCLFMFDDATTLAVKARRFSLETNGYSTSVISFAFACNGIGGAVYDTTNDRYFLMFYRNDDNTGAVPSTVDRSYLPKNFTAAANIVTLVSDSRNSSNSVYKDTSFILDGGFFYFAVPQIFGGLSESIYFNYVIFKINPLTGAVTQAFNYGLGNSLAEVTTSFVKKGLNITITGCRFDSASATGAVIIAQTLGNDSTKIKIEVRNQTSNFITVYNNNTNWGTEVNLLSDDSLNTPNAVAMGTTDTQIQVRFTLRTPNDSNIIPYVNSYKLFMNQNDTNSVTGTFTSETLIDDRLMADATLTHDITQDIGTVTWEMTNNGTTWHSVTPGVKFTFPNGASNNLKVRGSIALPSGAANANSTRINSYSVQTTNVVLQSDLYAMQVNMLKLGLQITALTTANRTDYKNMMIDLFETGAGVTGMTPTSGVITGTGTVTSVMETADILEVNSIIICAEATGTVTNDVSRDNGTTWHESVGLNTVIPLTKGTIKNQIRIRANLTSANLLGWAYLYA